MSRVEETRQKVDVAIAEIERGEVLDDETVVMQILEKFQTSFSRYCCEPTTAREGNKTA